MAASRKSNNYLPFERPLHELERKIHEFENLSRTNQMDFSEEIERLREKQRRLAREIFAGLSAWNRIELARHPGRPQARDYIARACTDFLELYGDRLYSDDQAVVAGFATLGAHRVMLIGQQKGRDTKEAIACNWGSCLPEGYRKALEKMKLAAKFGLPIVTLIDTKGAHPGMEAEERGQARAIALNLFEMSQLATPIICVVIGEGGSGGALGIGVGDRTCILEHAYYSVISPEGCAAILWKDAARKAEAAEALKLTARHLAELGVVDEVIPEPAGGAHRDPAGAAQTLQQALIRNLDELTRLPLDELLARRYRKLRAIGRWRETPAAEVAGPPAVPASAEPAPPPVP